MKLPTDPWIPMGQQSVHRDPMSLALSVQKTSVQLLFLVSEPASLCPFPGSVAGWSSEALPLDPLAAAQKSYEDSRAEPAIYPRAQLGM